MLTSFYKKRQKAYKICSLASTKKDRKLIKFAACQASGLSNKRASQQYGVYNFSGIRNEVKNALQHATAVRQQIFELASIKERATIESFGIYLGQESDSSTDEDSDSESGEASFDVDVDLEYNSSGGECGRCSISEEGGGVDEQADCGESDGVGTADNTCTTQENSVQSLNHERDKSQRHVVDPDNFSKDAAVVNPAPSHDHLLTILRANQLNWFAFVAELEQLLKGYSIDVL